MSEVGSLNLKELSKRAFSYFGGLSKSEVKQLINYTMIIENANGNLRGSLTLASDNLRKELDKSVHHENCIGELMDIQSAHISKIDELEKHISDLNARLEEKQAKIDAYWPKVQLLETTITNAVTEFYSSTGGIGN